MSEGKKVAADEAREKVQIIREMLADQCQQIVIAGSLRRGKALVGDGEIVAWAHDAPTLLARLDRLVATGAIKKSIYSDGRTRWGERYRGLSVEGLRVEIFMADQHNWGYQFWLRTGPGDANKWVMQQLIWQKAPYQPIEGYWWAGKHKISVPDEATLFKLLGSATVIPPNQRRIETYKGFLSRARWAQTFEIVTDEPSLPTQSSLF